MVCVSTELATACSRNHPGVLSHMGTQSQGQRADLRLDGSCRSCGPDHTPSELEAGAGCPGVVCMVTMTTTGIQSGMHGWSRAPLGVFPSSGWGFGGAAIFTLRLHRGQYSDYRNHLTAPVPHA